MISTTSSFSDKPRAALAQLAGGLCAGRVYRREDLLSLSNAVDRHLRELLTAGHINKLAPGMYYVPHPSSFGPLPPSDDEVISAFLRDKNYLVFSQSAYNSLQLGTTQLYNRTLVYNHKRHGVFKLGNRDYDFRMKPRFPKKLTPEFLFIDLLNNLAELAEDRGLVYQYAQAKLSEFDPIRLEKALDLYGSVAVKKRLRSWMNG